MYFRVARKADAAREPDGRRGRRGDGRDHERRGDARADRRAARRPHDEGRASVRDRRAGKDDARQCGAAVADVRRCVRHVRNRRRSLRHVQYFVGRGARGRGAGLRVAKHGNRSVSSQCGSADVYEALGVNIAAAPAVVERSLETVGIAFFFAPTFHPSMRHAAPVRRELGVRTAFNLLGPLTNPAGARRQLVGVPHSELTELIARALLLLGSERAWVVHGADGIDEMSTTGHTKVSECRNGAVSTFYVHPSDFGIAESRPPGASRRGRRRQRGDPSGGARRTERSASRCRAAECRRIALRRRESGVGARRHRACRARDRLRRRGARRSRRWSRPRMRV